MKSMYIRDNRCMTNLRNIQKLDLALKEPRFSHVAGPALVARQQWVGSIQPLMAVKSR